MIRQARINEAKEVARLAALMWTSHTEDELTEEYEQLISDHNSSVFLCFVDEIAIGFAQGQLRNDYVEGTQTSPVGYLEGIFVLEKYRGCGYARALLIACEKWAKEQGCTEFASDCELDNIHSYEFHLKSGFTEANRIICFTKRI